METKASEGLIFNKVTYAPDQTAAEVEAALYGNALNNPWLNADRLFDYQDWIKANYESTPSVCRIFVISARVSLDPRYTYDFQYIGWTDSTDPTTTYPVSLDTDFYTNAITDNATTTAQLPEVYVLTGGTLPSTPSNSGAGSTSNTETPAHAHSYSWVTVQEANAGQDGIEEYRCSCGDVQGRNVIPAPAFFVQELYTNITSAPTDGTITFDTGWLYTLSDYLLKMLAERSDVTTVITFEYEHQTYKMTIPAGADYSSLLADTDYFYGYFYFANAVGAVIEAI